MYNKTDFTRNIHDYYFHIYYYQQAVPQNILYIIYCILF